jgi:hypothetical protein
MVALREGRLDFGALQSVPRRRAAAGITIYYVAFDFLALGDLDVRAEPYRRRRERLEQLLAGVAPPLQLCPSTTDRASALHWMDPAMATRGIEGVVAKYRDKPYRAGRSGFWLKTRQKIVVDCHVLGFTARLQRPNALFEQEDQRTGDVDEQRRHEYALASNPVGNMPAEEQAAADTDGVNGEDDGDHDRREVIALLVEHIQRRGNGREAVTLNPNEWCPLRLRGPGTALPSPAVMAVAIERSLRVAEPGTVVGSGSRGAVRLSMCPASPAQKAQNGTKFQSS